jgi:hypothetical protein
VAWLVIAWALVGTGAEFRMGSFSPVAIVVVSGASVVLAVSLLTVAQPGISRRTLAVVLGATAFMAPFYPLHEGGADLLSVGIVLSIVVALAILVTGLVGDGTATDNRWRFTAIAGLVAVAGIATIIASPKPGNDVWYMYQASSNALRHGQNFYTDHWTSGLVGQDANGFGYLPGSALLLAPFRILFGDVRFGLLAATLFAAWCTSKLAGRSEGWVCGALILLFPKGNYGIAMSWTDPLLLAGMAAMVLAVRRRRLGWAIVAFAAVLACKQDAWLFLPLAAAWKDFGWKRTLVSATAAVAFCIPWAVAAPRAFGQGVFLLDWDFSPRSDSLSLFSVVLRLGVDPGYPLIAGFTLVALAAALLLLPRNSYGFVAGCALAMTGFNLASKQSFFNEWELAGGLIALSMAAALGDADLDLRPRQMRFRRRRTPLPTVVAG